jgi:hypothetical protein
MAMGKRKQEQQETLFIATERLANSPGHPSRKANRFGRCRPRGTQAERIEADRDSIE